MQDKSERQDLIKVLEVKYLQPRIFYPARLSFRKEGERKNFSDKQKLKEYSSNTKLILKEILKDLLKVEKKQEGTGGRKSKLEVKIL